MSINQIPGDFEEL